MYANDGHIEQSTIFHLKHSLMQILYKMKCDSLTVCSPPQKKQHSTRGSGCGQPKAGSALNEMLKLNFNDVDYNMFQLNQRSQIIL